MFKPESGCGWGVGFWRALCLKFARFRLSRIHVREWLLMVSCVADLSMLSLRLKNRRTFCESRRALMQL